MHRLLGGAFPLVEFESVAVVQDLLIMRQSAEIVTDLAMPLSKLVPKISRCVPNVILFRFYSKKEKLKM